MCRQTGKRWLSAKKLGSGLFRRLSTAQANDTFDVNIAVAGRLVDQVTLGGSPWLTRAEKIDAYKTRCSIRQSGLMRALARYRSKSANFDAAGAAHVGRVESFWINNFIRAELSLDAVRGISIRPDVEHLELANQPHQYGSLNGTPCPVTSDRSYPAAAWNGACAPKDATWSVTRIGAPTLWQQGLTGHGVVVAVLDSGVNYRHPDLVGQMWDGGEIFPHHGHDFERGGDDPTDENGHGTCCAGIVAGDGTCGLATGVAPRAQIMAVRVGSSETSCWQGLQFALENGAHVVNTSLAWFHTQNPSYDGWRRACETILATGVLHATSAGNKGDWSGPFAQPFNIGAPANCPPPWLNPAQGVGGGHSSAIACGATTESDLLDADSAIGPSVWRDGSGLYDDYPLEHAPGLIKPDLCAPGRTDTCNAEYPSVPGASAYTGFGRTSSASAHLAGSLALLAQACLRGGRSIQPARLQEALENSSIRIQGREIDLTHWQTRRKENGFGAGRIDVYAAYKYGRRRAWWG